MGDEELTEKANTEEAPDEPKVQEAPKVQEPSKKEPEPFIPEFKSWAEREKFFMRNPELRK